MHVHHTPLAAVGPGTLPYLSLSLLTPTPGTHNPVCSPHRSTPRYSSFSPPPGYVDEQGNLIHDIHLPDSAKDNSSSSGSKRRRGGHAPHNTMFGSLPVCMGVPPVTSAVGASGVINSELSKISMSDMRGFVMHGQPLIASSAQQQATQVQTGVTGSVTGGMTNRGVTTGFAGEQVAAVSTSLPPFVPLDPASYLAVSAAAAVAPPSAAFNTDLALSQPQSLLQAPQLLELPALEQLAAAGQFLAFRAAMAAPPKVTAGGSAWQQHQGGPGQSLFDQQQYQPAFKEEPGVSGGYVRPQQQMVMGRDAWRVAPELATGFGSEVGVFGSLYSVCLVHGSSGPMQVAFQCMVSCHAAPMQ